MGIYISTLKDLRTNKFHEALLLEYIHTKSAGNIGLFDLVNFHDKSIDAKGRVLKDSPYIVNRLINFIIYKSIKLLI